MADQEIAPTASSLPAGSAAHARTATLALIPAAVAFNIAVGVVVRTFKLPIYLDCIGGIVTSLMAGVWPGVAVAVISQIIGALATGPDFMFYTGTAVAMGVCAYGLGAARMFRNYWLAGIAGLILGAISATLSAPITYWRGGVTSAGSAWVTAIFLGTHHPLLQSVIYSGITCDIPDKFAEALISVWLIRSVPRDLLRRFHGKMLPRNFKIDG
jgi:energy-coupling factor transport system substrate-specific component